MITYISFLTAIIVMAAVTAIVSNIARRSPSMIKWKASRPGVLFIVCMRRWAYLLIRIFGIAVIVIGAIMMLASLPGTSGDNTSLGASVGGGIMIIGGIFFVWLAHYMARIRLEVTPDTIWVFPGVGAPRQVALSELTELKPLMSNNYGGIVARSSTERLFYASRVMLGYAQLIEYLQTNRPDLAIPEESLPL